MNPTKLYIKNMVCPRCILSVETILAQLGIPYEKVNLGEVELQKTLMPAEEENLQKELKKLGFELITDKHKRITSKIRSLIIEAVYKTENNNQKLSVLLTENLHRDYSQLSSIFSKAEGKSIQDFQNEVKIMRIKEFLEYDERNISQIADDLGYGNPAYLATQFKKATGLTPSQYKNQQLKARESLDKL